MGSSLHNTAVGDARPSPSQPAARIFNDNLSYWVTRRSGRRAANGRYQAELEQREQPAHRHDHQGGERLGAGLVHAGARQPVTPRPVLRTGQPSNRNEARRHRRRASSYLRCQFPTATRTGLARDRVAPLVRRRGASCCRAPGDRSPRCRAAAPPEFAPQDVLQAPMLADDLRARPDLPVDRDQDRVRLLAQEVAFEQPIGGRARADQVACLQPTFGDDGQRVLEPVGEALALGGEAIVTEALRAGRRGRSRWRPPRRTHRPPGRPRNGSRRGRSVHPSGSRRCRRRCRAVRRARCRPP